MNLNTLNGVSLNAEAISDSAILTNFYDIIKLTAAQVTTIAPENRVLVISSKVAIVITDTDQGTISPW